VSLKAAAAILKADMVYPSRFADGHHQARPYRTTAQRGAVSTFSRQRRCFLRGIKLVVQVGNAILKSAEDRRQTSFRPIGISEKIKDPTRRNAPRFADVGKAQPIGYAR